MRNGRTNSDQFNQKALSFWGWSLYSLRKIPTSTLILYTRMLLFGRDKFDNKLKDISFKKSVFTTAKIFPVKLMINYVMLSVGYTLCETFNFSI